MPDDNKPVDRRRFFRMGLGELLRPFAAAVQPLERVAEQLEKMDRKPDPAADPTGDRGSASVPPAFRKIVLNLWVRPPGALPETQFKSTCSRCGECVAFCPVQCIKIDSTGRRGDGVPFVDVDAAACVVCESLACMSACPTGALARTPMTEIDMGTAVWREETCVRTDGEDCTLCVDHCPLGTAAIRLEHGAVVVDPHHCTGCGVCQNRCPTEPKSVYVIPAAARKGRA